MDCDQLIGKLEIRKIIIWWLKDHISQTAGFIKIMSKQLERASSEACDSQFSASYISSERIYNNVLSVYRVISINTGSYFQKIS